MANVERLSRIFLYWSRRTSHVVKVRIFGLPPVSGNLR
mgnify:CR=1 FL=1